MNKITKVIVTFEDGTEHTYEGEGKLTQLSEVLSPNRDLRAERKPPAAFVNLFMEVRNDSGR